MTCVMMQNPHSRCSRQKICLDLCGCATMLRLLICSQRHATACRRFVAGGGTVPWLSKAIAASAALQLAATCCDAGRLEDEAPLLRLLHDCTTALRADVSAAASAREPAAAAGVAAADGVAAGAARAQAGPTAAKSAGPSQAAGGRPGAGSAQQQPASASRVGHANGVQPSAQLSAQQRVCDNMPQLLRQRLAEGLEWESSWAFPVASGLRVRHSEVVQVLMHLVPRLEHAPRSLSPPDSCQPVTRQLCMCARLNGTNWASKQLRGMVWC